MSVSSERAQRCAGCGGALEPTWQVCGWCGRPVDAVAASAWEARPAEPAGAQDGTVALASGTMLLGRYRVDSLLGRGGFGITYRARDTRLRRDVAVKELFPPKAFRHGDSVGVAEADRRAFEDARTRFQREATALARFNHPGIVRIFEVFEANNTAYLVMELVEGPSVGTMLVERGRPFGVDEVLDLALRVGDALGAVHAAGLLHRDVNPSNLVVDGVQRVVLIDFGLARRYGDDISGSLTRAVTPGYAPPEQYAGSARSGPPCDVFGLAATLYKLLTGTTPTNVFDRQAGAALPAPAALRDDIPPMISAAILDGMELDPGHRPATTEAFLLRLGLYGSTPGSRVLLRAEAAPVDATVPRLAGSPRPAAPPVVAPSPIEYPAPAAPRPASAPRVVAAPVPPPAVAARPASRPFAPWHDGGPPMVGPPARHRGSVTWPVGIALCALASAAPFVLGVLVALVVLPGLASVGDVVVHRYRRRTGAGTRRWHNAGVGVVAPVRFVRNLVVAMARALPAVAVGAIGYATERVIVDAASGSFARDLTVRVTGVAVMAVLLLPARHGGRGFRTDQGITACAEWAMERRDRPGVRAVVVWVICLAGVAFGAWLRPDLWPST